MTDFLSMSMNRRTAFKVGAGLGIAGGAGVLGYELVPPSPSAQLERVDQLARALHATLDAEQRYDTCVQYDHPLRQYHNRGVWGGGREVLFGFSRAQRRILTDLMHAGLSAEGRSRIPGQDLTKWSGVNGLRVLICGDPTNPPFQIIMSGAHLNLRLGGRSLEGAAFGGPQVYGDQRGNERAGLPGNVYRDQFQLAQRLLRNLDGKQQERAVIEAAPVQTAIELQGYNGKFPGIAIAELAPEQKALAGTLVDRIFATYAPDDVAYARACLQNNGGLDGLFLSYYEGGDDGAIPEAQVFRLEGPAAVLYFRGYPHVHAFINVAMNPEAPLSSGELLAHNPAWLDRAGVKKLLEAAMRAETGVDRSYYPDESVAGRLRPGAIRSGDIYTLESWQDEVHVGELRGSRIATTSYGLTQLREHGDRVESAQSRGMLRDLAVAYVKRHGFTAVTA
jgi:Protein of unknown function (DUF3500)